MTEDLLRAAIAGVYTRMALLVQATQDREALNITVTESAALITTLIEAVDSVEPPRLRE